MNNQQKYLVQSSFEKVVPIADTAAALFYQRLFELDPSLRPMFTTDLKEQGKKLMNMLTLAVRGLDKLDKLVPAIQDLGRRHAGYGVKAEHYDTVASALLWTLEKGLGDAFTDEVREAWVAVYMLIATTMQDAAAKVEPVTKLSYADPDNSPEVRQSFAWTNHNETGLIVNQGITQNHNETTLSIK
jgi:hemoglobin-like flavoprotein